LAGSRLFLTFFLILLQGLVTLSAQAENNRIRKIPAGVPQLQLDSLSIIAGSFGIWGPDGDSLDPAFYHVDFVGASIRLRIPEYWQNDSLLVSYRVFPLRFSDHYFHKDTSLIWVPGPGQQVLRVPLASSLASHGLISSESLFSSGSITRGISLGNRQDVSVNSAMNLQLSGNLGEDIEISAVISDQDIPFQPDGTTRQIQDFDKVFIKLSGKGGELTAGDFEVEKPRGHFMNFTRKAQGGMISYDAVNMAHSKGIFPGASMNVTAAGAIAKGKYSRNIIEPVEGSKGPYRLRGNNNESFIMILAGSEKVFIDGELLSRGMDNDYVIDYNMAEIIFSAKRMITRNSRIVVEFEYAERNFARSLLFSGVEIANGKSSVRFNMFSEQDHINQPLFQDLSSERISRMKLAGDSLSFAFDWNVDSIGFHHDRVMYRLTDSLGFDTVFVHSIDPQKAVYRVGFTYMGSARGNYVQVSSAANGRVFQWVAPVNGIPQGTHDPIINLVTPKKDQLMTLGGDFQISRGSYGGFELAVSNRDINLFSDLHKDNNQGHAFRLNYGLDIPFSSFGEGSWKLQMSTSHEYTAASFSALERFRPVEFERDWNLGHFALNASEHLSSAEVKMLHSSASMAAYRFQMLNRDDGYRGLNNGIEAFISQGKNKVFFKADLLNTTGAQSVSYYRHNAGISRQMLKIVAGIDHHMEDNDTRNADFNYRGLSFNEWNFYIQNPDVAKNRYRVFYKIREDYFPAQSIQHQVASSRDIGVSWELLGNPNQRLQVLAVQRTLELTSDNKGQQQSQRNMAGRIDHFYNLKKGLITSNVFYEAGSAMERQREYIYLEVPAGQGIYTWNDYNQNGIMELDEFEIAQFPDQAKFIRVFIQTQELIPVFSNLLSHSLNVNPAIAWSNEKGIKKFVSRFSNQLVYRIDRKIQGVVNTGSFNPYDIAINELELISMNYSMRNSLFFNRAPQVFGAEVFIQNSRNKLLLSNGFETRIQQNSGIRTIWNINPSFTLNIQAVKGLRENNQEYFLNRNFRIIHNDVEPMLSYQAAARYRIGVFCGQEKKKNSLPGSNESARIIKAGSEIRYSIPGKSSINGRYQISDIKYPFNANTPVAFEMLSGLMPGKNQLWTLGFQQNLNMWLQLMITYHGRKHSSSKTVHTASLQLRAVF
jgi:hypothetical protein